MLLTLLLAVIACSAGIFLVCGALRWYETVGPMIVLGGLVVFVIGLLFFLHLLYLMISSWYIAWVIIQAVFFIVVLMWLAFYMSSYYNY